MLKKEMDMIVRINKLLSALVEGDLSSKRLPKDLGEFEETFSLLTQIKTSLQGMTEQANQIAAGDYTTDIAPRSDKVLEAENGEDALRVSKVHEGSIDLMVTDVVMPKMGGKEVVKQLQPLYPHMKVIFMSGYTDDAIVHHGVLEPGLNFLEKPFSPESLGRKVREVLDIEN